jgi:hypothetical protein
LDEKWFIPMAAKWPKSNGAKRLHGQSFLVAKELQVWLKSDQPCQVTLKGLRRSNRKVSIICENRIKEPGKVALCMLLVPLSSTERLADTHLKFGWKPERVSRVINALLAWIHKKWKHLLDWPDKLLTPERLTIYAALVAGTGAPLQSCIGFVDGTLHEVSRPIYVQESVFNGGSVCIV